MGTRFEDLPLHDAILISLVVNWSRGDCVLRLKTNAAVHAEAGEYLLAIEGLRSLSLSRTEPWGPSVFVNRTLETGEWWMVELQSGDVLEVMGARFEFLPAEESDAVGGEAGSASA